MRDSWSVLCLTAVHVYAGQLVSSTLINRCIMPVKHLYFLTRDSRTFSSANSGSLAHMILFLRLYAITFELQLLKILSWSVLQKCVFWVYVLCPMKHVSFRNKHVWDRKEDQIIIKFEHIDFKVKVNHLLKIFTEILIYNPWQIRPSLRSQRCRFPKLLSFGRLRTWALALKKATEAEALVFTIFCLYGRV